SRRGSNLGAPKRLPTEDHQATADQRASQAEDDAAGAEARREPAPGDEPGQERAEDSEADVGQRARPGKRAHDPAPEPTGGGADADPEDGDSKTHGDPARRRASAWNPNT